MSSVPSAPPEWDASLSPLANRTLGHMIAAGGACTYGRLAGYVALNDRRTREVLTELEGAGWVERVGPMRWRAFTMPRRTTEQAT